MLDLSSAFASFPTLATERLVLRALTLDDVDAVFDIFHDPTVTRYFGQLPMRSRDEAVQRVAGIHAAFAAHSGVRWAIALRDGGALLGSCGFWRIEPRHARAELGYELAPAWWGQGIIPEALGAVLAFGFTTLGLHSVEAQIHPANRQSRRVLEKLGFVQEGYFHQNYYDPVEAGFTDTAVFSLLRASWQAGVAR